MSEHVFSGIKVADFTWAAAGPIMTKQFSDNGATVIKIEVAAPSGQRAPGRSVPGRQTGA